MPQARRRQDRDRVECYLPAGLRDRAHVAGVKNYSALLQVALEREIDRLNEQGGVEVYELQTGDTWVSIRGSRIVRYRSKQLFLTEPDGELIGYDERTRKLLEFRHAWRELRDWLPERQYRTVAKMFGWEPEGTLSVAAARKQGLVEPFEPGTS